MGSSATIDEAGRPVSRPFEPVPRRALDPSSGCGAADRLLIEQPAAVPANLALDVIRDAASLPDGVDRDRGVLVRMLQGHCPYSH